VKFYDFGTDFYKNQLKIVDQPELKGNKGLGLRSTPKGAVIGEHIAFIIVELEVKLNNRIY
jgi:hypothetical protein